MRKLLLVAVCLLNSAILRAHDPQLSTITLIQSKNNQWNLVVGSGLSACQYELKNSYPDINIDSLDANRFQALLLQHLKETIQIKCGSYVGELTNGMIILGHQTDVRFDVIGMPKKVTSLEIKQLGFGTLKNHSCILKVIAKSCDLGTFILQDDNNFSVVLEVKNSGLIEKVSGKSVSHWWFFISVACSAGFVFLYFTYRRRAATLWFVSPLRAGAVANRSASECRHLSKGP